MNRATLLTLAWGTLVGAASAAPSDVEVPSAYRTAAAWTRGAALLGDLSEGRYEGRRLFLRGADLAIAPTDRLALWFGESDATAFGRASDSRLRVHSDRQAIRYRLGARRGMDFAVQADRFGTTDAVATTDSGSTTTRAVFAATHGYSVSTLATRGLLDLSLGVGYVHTEAEDARTFSASVGYRLPVARNLVLWGQGTLTGADSGGGAKPILRGQLRYAPNAWSALTLEGLAFLHGLPADDPLGSFLLYNPGGSAASGLENKALGYGAIRLSFGVRF